MTPLSLTAAIVADAEASFDAAVPKLPAQLEALVMGDEERCRMLWLLAYASGAVEAMRAASRNR